MRVRLLALGLCCFLPAFGLDAQEKEGPTPDEALRRLKEGNARFVAGKARAVEVGLEKYRELLRGQRPVAAVLACADSRVPPEHLFNKGFGDLFVCRVAGNVAEPYVLGSVEYAVETLNVPLLVVLGHENCGAVQAAVKKAKPGGNLEKLLGEIKVGDGLPADREAALAAAARRALLALGRPSTGSVNRDRRRRVCCATDGEDRLLPLHLDLPGLEVEPALGVRGPLGGRKDGEVSFLEEPPIRPALDQAVPRRGGRSGALPRSGHESARSARPLRESSTV